MKFSIYFAVSIIVVLLFLASAISLLFALADKNTFPLILTAAANIVAVILLVFLITRGILTPLGQVRNIMKKVGEGNLNLKIAPPGIKEMQELGDTLNEMIVQLRTSTQELQEKLTELERFEKLAVGRELKMIELKEEIKKLGDPVPRQKTNAVKSRRKSAA